MRTFREDERQMFAKLWQPILVREVPKTFRTRSTEYKLFANDRVSH